LELLSRRGGPVDEQRGRLRDHVGPAAGSADLVRCLVEPYCEMLHSGQGRSYVRIVAQLRGRFAAWRVESDSATTVHLSEILDELEQRPDLPEPLRRERVVALIMVMTGSSSTTRRSSPTSSTCARRCCWRRTRVEDKLAGCPR
jgi:hypothetical protein